MTHLSSCTYTDCTNVSYTNFVNDENKRL